MSMNVSTHGLKQQIMVWSYLEKSAIKWFGFNSNVFINIQKRKQGSLKQLKEETASTGEGKDYKILQ